MSIFRRALGAVGRAGGQMANRYIDEDLAMKRAQFMADLQRTSEQNRRQDQEDFDARTAPARNQRAADATVAQGAATDQVALNRLRNEELNQAGRDKAAADARAGRAAKVEELTDSALQQATDADARRKAERDAQIQRDQVKATAADPGYLKAAETIALSDPKVKAQIEASRAAAANAFASAAQTREQTEAIRRVNDITKEMTRVLDDPKLDDATRQKELAKLQSKLMVFGGGKKGEGGGATEKVTTEYGPDGKPLGSKREVTGPLGAAAAADAKSDPAAQVREAALGMIAAGRGAEAVAAMEKQGRTPPQIVALIGEENYAKIKGTDKKSGPPQPRPAQRDPIQTMSMSDLRRIASIDGHASQDQAKAELERRRQNQVLPDETGLGVMP